MLTYRWKRWFLRSFSPRKSFLCINPYISVFQGKRHNFGIILKQSFLVHKFVNINISTKITLFLVIFEKVVFCPYIGKYQHIEKSTLFRHHFWNSFFIYLAENTNISRKITYFDSKMLTYRWKRWFLRSFWRNRFLCINPYISVFQGESHHFGIILKTSFLIHKFVNIKISTKIALFWDIFEKLIFYSYIRKYQYFEKRTFLISL